MSTEAGELTEEVQTASTSHSGFNVLQFASYTHAFGAFPTQIPFDLNQDGSTFLKFPNTSKSARVTSWAQRHQMPKDTKRWVQNKETSF